MSRRPPNPARAARALFCGAALVGAPAVAQEAHLSAGAGGGGGPADGGAVVAQISIGDAFSGGVSTGGNLIDKGGFTGQLFDPRSLSASAAPDTVDEGAARQLDASATLDDDTTLNMPGEFVGWSVQSGPIVSISATGLAVAGAVFEDTAATVVGSWGGLTADVDLTVLDIDPDNFGLYAGDGLEDTWQIGFFGLENPDAGPARDPDGDGQSNAFEFLAVVDPTDPLSLFCAELTAENAVTFSPVSPLRTYRLSASTAAAPPGFSVVPADASDAGGERTLSETAPPPGPRRFYRIDISD